MNLSLSGINCYSLAKLKNEIDRLNLAPTVNIDSANSIFNPLGKSPAKIAVLLDIEDLQSININNAHSLEIEDDDGNTVTFSDLYFIKEPAAIFPSSKFGENSLYFCELSDTRWLCNNPHFSTFINETYNAKAHAYASKNLENASMTWQQVITDIVGHISMMTGIITDTIPAAALTNAGTPANLIFNGMSAWSALCQALDMLNCAISWDGSAYSIVQLGVSDATAAATLTAAVGRMIGNEWPYPDAGIIKGRIPASVTVCFHKSAKHYGTERDVPDDDNWQYLSCHSIEIANPSPTGTATGSTAIIWDEMHAVIDTDGTVTNSSALSTRANKRATEYLAKLGVNSSKRLRATYAGVVEIFPGSTIRAVVHHESSTPLTGDWSLLTEIASFADYLGPLEPWENGIVTPNAKTIYPNTWPNWPRTNHPLTITGSKSGDYYPATLERWNAASATFETVLSGVKVTTTDSATVLTTNQRIHGRLSGNTDGGATPVFWTSDGRSTLAVNERTDGGSTSNEVNPVYTLSFHEPSFVVSEPAGNVALAKVQWNTTTPLPVAEVGDVGTGEQPARWDHVHGGMPGTVIINQFGDTIINIINTTEITNNNTEITQIQNITIYQVTENNYYEYITINNNNVTIVTINYCDCPPPSPTPCETCQYCPAGLTNTFAIVFSGSYYAKVNGGWQLIYQGRSDGNPEFVEGWCYWSATSSVVRIYLARSFANWILRIYFLGIESGWVKIAEYSTESAWADCCLEHTLAKTFGEGFPSTITMYPVGSCSQCDEPLPWDCTDECAYCIEYGGVPESWSFTGASFDWAGLNIAWVLTYQGSCVWSQTQGDYTAILTRLESVWRLTFNYDSSVNTPDGTYGLEEGFVFEVASSSCCIDEIALDYVTSINTATAHPTTITITKDTDCVQCSDTMPDGGDCCVIFRLVDTLGVYHSWLTDASCATDDVWTWREEHDDGDGTTHYYVQKNGVDEAGPIIVDPDDYIVQKGSILVTTELGACEDLIPCEDVTASVVDMIFDGGALSPNYATSGDCTDGPYDYNPDGGHTKTYSDIARDEDNGPPFDYGVTDVLNYSGNCLYNLSLNVFCDASNIVKAKLLIDDGAGHEQIRNPNPDLSTTSPLSLVFDFDISEMAISTLSGKLRVTVTEA